ncbi:hypothetical protein ACRALDRAFT_2026411 [Sodiomyces alcalophilus JCM 7366]|uniref:uncharacterized protein n=1 Tax=Sodiomyces alcalophilus JCM 7366 TaxID=591952 RepID=UPI0039B381F2
MSDKGKSPHVFSPEAALVRGRDAYASGRHKKAIDYFTSIINSCDCNRRERRKICRCKDFKTVARNGGSIFHEAMYNCKCQASQKWDKCHDPHHIRALDYRAAVFEKEDLHFAKRDAEWLLEIAPRALDGYLRLGKIYRLEKKPKVALAIWNAGIEVGRKEGLGGSRKMKQLYEVRQPLQMHYVRRDPMTLPVELVEKIFSYFQLTELWYVPTLPCPVPRSPTYLCDSRVQGVCKQWDYFFNSRPFVWRHLEFPARPKKPPPLSWTRKLVRRMRGAAHSLVIPGPVQQKLTGTQWLQLADAAKQARRLELDLRHGITPPLPPDRRFASQLTSLKVIFPEIPTDESYRETRSFLHGILTHSHFNLESLWLGHPEIPWFRPDWSPVLARLRYLRLSGIHRSTCISLLYLEGPFAIRTNPDDCISGETVPDENYLDEGAWPNLRVLIAERKISLWFDAPTATNNDPNYPYPPSNPPFLKKVQVFESRTGSFRFEKRASVRVISMTDTAELARGQPVNSMGSMERYWTETMPLNPSAQQRLQPSLDSGKLYELGLAFPDPAVSELIWGSNPLPAQVFLQSLPWLYGGPGVRTLGLFNFNLDSDLTIPIFMQAHLGPGPVDRDQATVLINFIQSFPRLESLVLGSTFCDPRQIAVLTEALANRGKIKRFYLQGVTGQTFLDLRELVATKGAEVMFWQDKIPWPYPLTPHPDGL